MDGGLTKNNAMKYILLLFLVAPALFSCGGKASGTDLSKEVCDCYKRANGLPTTDPNRSREQDACIQKQAEAWKKIKDDREESDKFNQAIADCSRGMIEGSVQ